MANIDYSIVLGTDDDDSIYNDSYGSTIDAGDGNDTIQNIGANVSIGGGRDNDSIYSWRGSYCTIDGGDDNDIIRNGISNMSINGGNGDDSIYIEYDVDKVTISGGKGNDYITSNGSKVLFQYNYGDGRNIIYGFEADSTLSISGGSYSTTKNGEDVIVHVGDGQVILNQVADLKKINIVAKEVMENSWTLNEPAAIYGTNNNTLIKVTGIKSLDGLSLNENSKVVTVAKSSLSDSKVTISDGYTLKLADDVPKSKTTKATWSLNGSTAIYKSSSKTAGYTLAKDGKSVSYTKATTAKNLATITGAKSTNGLTLSGNKITLKNSALKNKVTIGGGYEFNFASDYKKATITGSKNADTITANGNNLSINGGAGDDTIKFFGTATTVKGGTGKDLFVYKSGKNVIADYAAEDKISIAGTAKVTTSGSDVIFIVGSNKLTVKGGKGKNITYVDAGGEQVYPEQNNDVIINGKAITLTEDYLEDSFNVADYSKTLQTIDASAVQLDLSITGNKLMNSIVGGKGNDTLNGGGSNDTLTGGAGSDVFLYNTGDGNDVITDYTEDDIIHIAKGTAKIEKKGKDVIFKVGTGKITVKGAADKVVTYIDAKGKTNYYPKPTSDSIIINGTAVTVLEEYKSDTFDVGNVKNGNRVKKIDASPVSRDLKIIGNSLANVMLGGAGDDSIWGGKGNDTLQGGDGSDVFVYSNGDGKDIILDYEEDDTIKITKGTAKVTTKGSDVIFTIGSGKITVLGAADKTVSYIDANGNKKTYGSTASFLEDDTNYELTPRNDLSSIVQSKAADYSFLNTSTKLSKETNLIAYSDKK